MCLAIPMRVVEIEAGGLGLVEAEGIRREADLSLVDAEIGDYVIIHAGYAIEKLDTDEADTRIELFREIGKI